MRADAFVGLLALCGLATPAVVWLILRRTVRLDGQLWLALYVLGAALCVAVLPRKHLTSAVITRWPRNVWVYMLDQVYNEWWEQIGKLVAILIVLWLANKHLRPALQRKNSATAIGYWTGLCYGIGEAVILAVLFTWPQWGPLFGLRTFTPYVIAWPFVWERLGAVHVHAVMGALIGLGLYGWIGLGRPWRLVGFFVLAMAYHHLVDGLIIATSFVPFLSRAINQLGQLFVPAMVVVGLVVLCLAYRWAPIATPDDGNRG